MVKSSLIGVQSNKYILLYCGEKFRYDRPDAPTRDDIITTLLTVRSGIMGLQIFRSCSIDVD